jgi:hypothetical protein
VLSDDPDSLLRQGRAQADSYLSFLLAEEEHGPQSEYMTLVLAMIRGIATLDLNEQYIRAELPIRKAGCHWPEICAKVFERINANPELGKEALTGMSNERSWHVFSEAVRAVFPSSESYRAARWAEFDASERMLHDFFDASIEVAGPAVTLIEGLREQIATKPSTEQKMREIAAKRIEIEITWIYD